MDFNSNLSHCTMFSINRTYFMDVFNMTYVKNTTVHKLKKTQQKHPVYKDKSDSRRKVVIVSRYETL